MRNSAKKRGGDVENCGEAKAGSPFLTRTKNAPSEKPGAS